MGRHFTVRDFENLSRCSKSSLMNGLKHEGGGLFFRQGKSGTTAQRCANVRTVK